MAGECLHSNLLRFIEFLALEKIPALIPTTLEAVRHLPLVYNGPLFSVRKHVRANAMGRDVVIKVFTKSLSPGTTSAPTEEELNRILKEIRILSSKPVVFHPNLIGLESLEFGIHSGDPLEICPALVLERAPHGNLDQFLEKNKTLSWQVKKALCLDIANGLDCLHRHGVLHGDLKPSHVLIFDHPERQYMAKLTGFGDSQILTCAKSKEELSQGGTRPLRAPEVEEGSTTFDQALRTDVFSLGLLFWSIFVNQDFSKSFDLPLDKQLRENDIIDILKLPYLYRFIPLLIEHEIGMIEEDKFCTLQKIFACTVRISPRSRDLKQTLNLLESRHENPDTISNNLESSIIKEVISTFDEVTVPANVLKTLPYFAARQYLEAIRSLHQTADTSTKLTKSATWIEFLCHLYGYGTKQSPQRATEVLAKSLTGEGELTEFASLVPVLREALSIESESQGTETGSGSPNQKVHCGGKIGPWINLGQKPTVMLEDHGVLLGEQEAASLGSKIQEDDDALGMDCGASNTLLHVFAIFGQLRPVMYLIEQEKVDVNSVNDKGETALLLACRYGNHEIALHLLDNNADASIDSIVGESGLHWLCSFPGEHVDSLALELIKKGARLLDEAVSNEMKDWKPITPGIEFLKAGNMHGNPLLRAVSNRDGRSAGILLHLSRILISTLEPRVQLVLLVTQVLERPLRLACELHLYDIVQNLCDEFRQIVQALPEAAILPSLKDLVDSMRTDSYAIGRLLTEITDSTSLIHGAVDMNFHVHRLCYHRKGWDVACRRTLTVLVRYGFLTGSLRTETGVSTVLAYAVRCGNMEALSFLLETDSLRATIDFADNRGYTLVHHAIEAHQFNALLLLAKHGATLDLRKKKDPKHCLSGVGASYLHVLASVRCDDLAVIQLFLDHGVPPTICDDRGISALSLALMRGAFPLARTLIAEGASILHEGIFGLTPLGELFVSGQADQHDDLFSTFKFLLSYRERGIHIFITRQQHRYTIFHTAAAYYRDDELYPRMLDMLLQSFGDRRLLEATAATPAKSTALQIAIGMYNPVVVKALVVANVNLREADSTNRTPLDYAMELLYRLVHKIDDGKDEDRFDKLERISTIILLLSEKAGWPEAIEQFPKLLSTFDTADPLLKKMMCSEHQVAFMRHLEQVILPLISEGYADMLPKMVLHHLDLVRRISMRRLQPALRMDLEYRVIPYDGFTDPVESFEKVKKAIPWCSTLTNNYLQDFQLAASFEWLLDLIQRDALRAGQLKDMTEFLKKYAFSGKRSDLSIDAKIVRYPCTLLQWYEKAISDDILPLKEEDKRCIQRSVQTLRARREARIQGKFPLPPFTPEFKNLHFDQLQVETLDPSKALATVLLVTRCRCFFDRIGPISRFKMTQLCLRMTSIDEDMFLQRLSKMRHAATEEIDKLCEWKSRAGVPVRRTSPISIMSWILVDEQLNRKESLLTHPEDISGSQDKVDRNKLSKENIVVPIITAARSAFPYEPLDFDKTEIRLLTILPDDSEANGIVSCRMDHYSVAPTSYTPEYREYWESTDKKRVRPSDFHKGWRGKNTLKRFIWGDFSCLSYTWGNPNDTTRIMVNEHAVTVGSNLEAALRSFRQQEEFQAGLMLWADALCINQNDTSEKEKTIREMQNIYLGAHTVTVWLGTGNADSDASLHVIQDFIARYSKPPGTVSNELHSELVEAPPLWYSNVVYPAIVCLMDRPYWRRLWIMQEITACAPCEKIYLGNHCISWRELVLLLKSYMSYQDATERGDEYTEVLNNRVLASVKQAYVLTNMAELYQHLPGLGKLNTSVEYGDASSWMYLGATSEVTDERDRVYGILGLVPANIASLVMPSYTKSIEDVYRDLSRALIEATGCFDECFHGSSKNNTKLASWAVDMRDTSIARPKSGRAGGYGNPYDDFLKTGQMYRIKIHKRPTPDDPIPDEADDSAHYKFSDDDSVLIVVAIHIDTVEGISGSVSKNTTPMTILDAPWKPSETPLNLHAGATARETILRVMTADAAFTDEENGILDIPFFEGLEPEPTLVEELHNNGWSDILRSDAFRVFHKFRLRKGEYPLFRGKHLDEWFSKDITPCDPVAMRKVMSRISTISERTFITTNKGNLGSTGVAVKDGDRVFVALGCSYPFLARRDGDVYRIVGECYLDGFMNGEALEMVADGKLEFENIQLQ